MMQFFGRLQSKRSTVISASNCQLLAMGIEILAVPMYHLLRIHAWGAIVVLIRLKKTVSGYPDDEANALLVDVDVAMPAASMSCNDVPDRELKLGDKLRGSTYKWVAKFLCRTVQLS